MRAAVQTTIDAAVDAAGKIEVVAVVAAGSKVSAVQSHGF